MIPNSLIEQMKVLRILNEVNEIGKKKLVDMNQWTEAEINEAFSQEASVSTPQPSQLPPISPPSDIYQPVQPISTEQLPSISNIPQSPVVEQKKKTILPLIIILLIIIAIIIGAYFYFTKTKLKSITSIISNITPTPASTPNAIQPTAKRTTETISESLTDLEGKPYQLFNGYTNFNTPDDVTSFVIDGPDLYKRHRSPTSWMEPGDAYGSKSTNCIVYGSDAFYQKINYLSLNDLPTKMTHIMSNQLRRFNLIPGSDDQIKIDTTKLVTINGREMNQFTATINFKYDSYDRTPEYKYIYGYAFIANNTPTCLIGLYVDQIPESKTKVINIVEKMIRTGRVMKFAHIKYEVDSVSKGKE